MSELHMDVFLLNTPQPGIDQRTLSRKLAAVFKKDIATVDKMLGQPRTRIKKDVDQALAKKYKKIIEAVGGQCELVSRALPVTSVTEESSSTPPPVAHASEETRCYCEGCGAPGQWEADNCPTCSAPPMHLIVKNSFSARVRALSAVGLGNYRVYLAALVMLVAILGAWALPAYQDYRLRSKVQSAMPLVDNARNQITKHIKKTNRFPGGNSEAGLPEAISSEVIASMILRPGAKLEVTFNLPSLSNSNNTIIWLPTRKGAEITWSCTGGTLPDAYRMRECRSGGAAVNADDKNAVVLSERMFSDDQRVSIDLPKGWKAHSSLSDDASISAAHVSGATYALVIQESKPDFEPRFSLSEYTQSIISLMKNNMKNGHAADSVRKLQVNGLAAEQAMLTGAVESIKVAYVLTTIESEQGFYQVLTWTLASRLTEQHSLLRTIGESFVIHQEAN